MPHLNVCSSASSEILTSRQDFHLRSSEHLFYFRRMRLKLFLPPKVNNMRLHDYFRKMRLKSCPSPKVNKMRLIDDMTFKCKTVKTQFKTPR